MPNNLSGLGSSSNTFRSSGGVESLLYPTGSRPKELVMDPWDTIRHGAVSLGDISICRHDGLGLRSFVRSTKCIHEDGVRDFIVSIPLHARTYLLREGKASCCDPGTFRILSLAKPFSASTTAFNSQGAFSLLVARIAGAFLRKEVPGIDDISNIPIRLRSGTGMIMKSLIEVGLMEGKALSPYHANDFSKTAIHAVANAVLDAPEFEQHQLHLHKTSFERITECAMLFIEANLSNPVLDNALVATHCQVSERYLQKAFTSLNIKVAAYIREMRLEHCKADLNNPKLYNHAIADIAMRWGFENSATFSRAYKERFGISPSKEMALKKG